jgi:ABC-type uncharacterized transport system ATPase component
MVIGIFGENCAGKSTLADEIARRTGAEVVTGRDYLRMAKSEAEAERLFRAKLADSGASVIYVISDFEQLALLPDGAKRIYVRADLETIRERFKARMHGVLPPPVAAMLEKKHGMFDGERADSVFDGACGDPAAFCAETDWL